MKRWKCLLVCLLLAVCAVGCGTETVYGSDVSATAVAATGIEAIGTADDYTDGTAQSYEFYFGESVAAGRVEDCCMMFHRTATNVNEIGVLRMTDDKYASEVKYEVRQYLESQTEYLRSFAQSYSPEDIGKIDNAGYRIFGDYIVYYVLDSEDEVAALSAIEALLTVDQ